MPIYTTLATSAAPTIMGIVCAAVETEFTPSMPFQRMRSSIAVTTTPATTMSDMAWRRWRECFWCFLHLISLIRKTCFSHSPNSLVSPALIHLILFCKNDAHDANANKEKEEVEQNVRDHKSLLVQR